VPSSVTRVLPLLLFVLLLTGCCRKAPAPALPQKLPLLEKPEPCLAALGLPPTVLPVSSSPCEGDATVLCYDRESAANLIINHKALVDWIDQAFALCGPR